MANNLSFRSKLLSTTALAVAGSVWMSAAAMAGSPSACVTVPGAVTTITCTGTNNVAIDTAGDPSLVTLNPDASLGVTGETAVNLTSDSDLILNSASLIHAQQTKYAVTAGGDNISVTLNDGGHIRLSQDSSFAGSGAGINIASGSGNSITLNGGSTIDVYGAPASKYIGRATRGVKLVGSNFAVELNDASSINVIGTGTAWSSTYTGIEATGYADTASDRATITLNGASQINVSSSADNASSDSLFGIRAQSTGGGTYGPDVTLNGGSQITLNANNNDLNAYGIYAKSVNANVTLSGGSVVRVNGYGSTGGGKYAGIFATELGGSKELAGAVTLNGGSDVQVYVDGVSNKNLNGIVSYGFGGAAANVVLNNSGIDISVAGGSNNTVKGVYVYGADATVTLNGDSTLNLGGDADTATGIYVHGTGSQVVLNGNALLNVGDYYDTANASGIVGIGEGVSVTLNDDARVSVNAYGGGHGDFAGVVLRDAAGASLTLNGNAQISVDGYDRQDGVLLDNADGASVTLGGTSSIGANGHGLFVKSNSTETNITIGVDASISGRNGITVEGNRTEINVAGTVYGWNTAIDLAGGSNSTLTLNSARIFGGILANGSDHLILDGAGALFDDATGFGDINVDASGIWNFASGATFSADDVEVNAGKLAVNGTLTADTVNVNSGGTLGGTGDIDAAINVLAGGTLAPGNSPGTLNVVGNVNFASGSFFDVEIDPTVADLLNVTGNVTIAPGAVIHPIFGAGADGFVGDIVTSTGVITGVFTPGNGASVDYSDPTKLTLTAASPSSVNGSMGAGSAAGFGFLDTVLGQAEKSRGQNKNLWASVVSTHSDRTASVGSRGFSQKGNGGAFGGNLMQAGGFTLGLAGGYTDTKATTSGGGARSTIDGYNAALYTSYEMGSTYIVAAVTGAYQDMDITRQVFSSGSLIAANGNTNAWLGGAGFGIGHAIPLDGGFTLTPKASLGWQHQTRKGYTETGGGAGGFSVDDVSSDTIRGLVGAELGLKIQDPNAKWSLRPSIRAGLAQEWREGDASASGTFSATGGRFTSVLDTRDQTYLAVGAGVDVTLGGGVTGFASYDGGFGGDAEKSGGIRIGARFEW